MPPASPTGGPAGLIGFRGQRADQGAHRQHFTAEAAPVLLWSRRGGPVAAGRHWYLSWWPYKGRMIGPGRVLEEVSSAPRTASGLGKLAFGRDELNRPGFTGGWVW